MAADDSDACANPRPSLTTRLRERTGRSCSTARPERSSNVAACAASCRSGRAGACSRRPTSCARCTSTICGRRGCADGRDVPHARPVARGGGPRGRAAELCELAVRLAREARRNARGRDVLVLGSAAPLEDCYHPERVPAEGALAREHARARAPSGARRAPTQSWSRRSTRCARASPRRARAATRAPSCWSASSAVARLACSPASRSRRRSTRWPASRPRRSG